MIDSTAELHVGLQSTTTLPKTLPHTHSQPVLITQERPYDNPAHLTITQSGNHAVHQAADERPDSEKRTLESHPLNTKDELHH